MKLTSLPIMLDKFRKSSKKIIVMLSTGILISLLFLRNSSSSPDYFLSDMFFLTAMIFLICGLYQFISNVGIFNSFVFGTKSLAKLFRSKLGPSEQVKDEYLEYTQSRSKYGDTLQLIIISAGLLLISVLASLI